MKNNISKNAELLGLTWITEFSAMQKYKQNKNIFVKFYFHDLDNNRLKETTLFLIEKFPIGTHYEKINKCFSDSHNQITMQNIFPNNIFDTFYFTDNRTKIPKGYEKIENKRKLLQLELF